MPFVERHCSITLELKLQGLILEFLPIGIRSFEIDRGLVLGTTGSVEKDKKYRLIIDKGGYSVSELSNSDILHLSLSLELLN
jgi:hypothetical protein